MPFWFRHSGRTHVILAAIAVAATFAVAGPVQADEPATVPASIAKNGNGTLRQPRILFLNSYHYGYEWSDSLSIGAMQVFRQAAPEARVYIEYLDSKHFDLSEERQAAELQRILTKYGDNFFDIVLASDDPAFNFIHSYRDTLAPGKPVVFCGVNVMRPELAQIPEGFTGIIEPFDYTGIISMVKQVFPERRSGYLIVDNSITGRSLIQVARQAIPADSGVELNILDGSELSHEELLQALRNLGSNAFVVIGLWQTDRNGHYFNVSEAFQDISNASPAPVFVILRTSLSLGYAGGVAVSGVHQGRVAAGMVLDILAGKPVADIPVSNDNVFDRMLNRTIIEKRWNVDWESLPEDIKRIPNSFSPELETPYSPKVTLSRAESEYLSSHPVIRVTIMDAPPLQILGSTPTGIVVDYMNEVARLTGMNLEYVQCEKDLRQCAASLPGDTPFVIPALTQTHDAHGSYLFSTPYMRLQSMIFTKEDSRMVIGLEALKGRKVGVSGRGVLQQALREEYPGIEVVVFDSSRQALIALNKDEIDAFVGFLSVGVTLIRELGFNRIRIAAPTNLTSQPISVAVPIDQPLLAAIVDKGIAAMPENAAERLRARYLDDVELKLGWRTETVLKFLLGIASIFIIVILILMRRDRRIRNASRRRELNLQVTLDSIGDAVIVTDNGRRVQRMNPVARQLTGWSDSDALGKRLDEVLVLVDPETSQPLSLPCPVPGEPEPERNRSTARIQLVAKNSSKYQIEHNVSLISDLHGLRLGQVIVFRDVSKRQQIQDQIQHSRKMEAIGQLAGGVAHDFNNMLSAIQGYSELILKKVPDGSNEGVYCQRILNATERAAGLTSKLLDFARKGKALSTPIDIHESIRSALGLLERSIDKSIVISSSLNAHNSLIVGDPGQIQSIILNLCINARDAMPNGGALDINTKNVFLTALDCRDNEFPMIPGEHVAICVTDSGTGIPPKVLEHIFEPFFTTKEVGKGTGLGLAAVHGAILEHSGSIKVYSEVGKGTQFNIYLPVSRERAAPIEETYVGDTRHHGVVLVVEDEPLIRTMAEIMLREIGFEVLTAENGAIGVETFKQNADSISLVLMDVIMPEMDGMTALLNIKAIKPQTLFIVTSGFSFEHRREEFMKAGAAAFIGKPFRNYELLKAVDDCLKKN